MELPGEGYKLIYCSPCVLPGGFPEKRGRAFHTLDSEGRAGGGGPEPVWAQSSSHPLGWSPENWLDSASQLLTLRLMSNWRF